MLIFKPFEVIYLKAHVALPYYASENVGEVDRLHVVAEI